jgi:hypothetical protein
MQLSGAFQKVPLKFLRLFFDKVFEKYAVSYRVLSGVYLSCLHLSSFILYLFYGVASTIGEKANEKVARKMNARLNPQGKGWRHLPNKDKAETSNLCILRAASRLTTMRRPDFMPLIMH